MIVLTTDFKNTWTYDPVAKTWSEIPPAGLVPPERSYGSMAYDPSIGRVLLFGGWHGSSPIDEGTTFNDTWSYGPVANVWSELHPMGDAPTQGSGNPMIYDSVDSTAILFAGHEDGTDEVVNDTWAYDPATNTLTGLGHTNGPMRRLDGCSVVYVPTSGLVYLFGGAKLGQLDYDTVDETWTYNVATSTWTQLHPGGDVPSARGRSHGSRSHRQSASSPRGRPPGRGNDDSSR